MPNYNHEIQPRDKSRDTAASPQQLELRFPTATDRDDRGHQPPNSALPEVGATAMLTPGDPKLGTLYDAPVPSRRSGPLYNAFSYPTKIDPEAIALFIAAHTSPGDTVLDVFAGSGTTGIAARLCDRPTEYMVAQAERLGLPVEWGPRHAVLYELSVVGALLAEVMCTPPDPGDFAQAADQLLSIAEDQYGWLYNVDSPDGSTGQIRHSIWTEVLECPDCGEQQPYWDLAVEREPLALRREAPCRACGVTIVLGGAKRATTFLEDGSDGSRDRRLAFVYGRSGSKSWRRPPVDSDHRLLARIDCEPIPACVPDTPLWWGDLHRSGYHQGVKGVRDLYTRRNLIALGTLWSAIEDQPERLRPSLRLLVLSYNASHSTLMTRVVVKKDMKDFVLTGAQSGVLYVSSLPVEKNVFAGVRRKVATFAKAFATTHGCGGSTTVVNASSTHLDLPSESVDYVFTDPPFGDFIPYSEINQLNEAWLGSLTDRTEEAIISPAQDKAVDDYGSLMKSIFSEVTRVLSPEAAATVVFHSSKPEVWSALGEGFTSAGLTVERTSVLDKTQVSFKQVVSEGTTRGDAIFLLRPGDAEAVAETRRPHDLRDTIVDLRKEHGDSVSVQHLYSRYVARCVERGDVVAASARDFYAAADTMGQAP